MVCTTSQVGHHQTSTSQHPRRRKHGVYATPTNWTKLPAAMQHGTGSSPANIQACSSSKSSRQRTHHAAAIAAHVTAIAAIAVAIAAIPAVAAMVKPGSPMTVVGGREGGHTWDTGRGAGSRCINEGKQPACSLLSLQSCRTCKVACTDNERHSLQLLSCPYNPSMNPCRLTAPTNALTH